MTITICVPNIQERGLFRGRGRRERVIIMICTSREGPSRSVGEGVAAEILRDYLGILLGAMELYNMFKFDTVNLKLITHAIISFLLF